MTYEEWRGQYTLSAIQADHETIVHSAFAAGWKAGYKLGAWGETNFCPRCGKRLASGFVEISIHTCTPPQPEQEPKTYALLYPQADYVATSDERPWVGLTDEEVKACLGPEAVRIPPGWRKLTRAIEAKLKEKNT